MFHTQKNRSTQARTFSGTSSEVCETQQRVPATFEVRDHALNNDNTVVIELTVDLPVFIGEFPVGRLLRRGDESESLVAFISESIVRIEKPIQSVVPVRERVMVCSGYRVGNHQRCPV